MSKVDDRVPSAGPPDDGPHRHGLRRRLTRLRADLLRRAWADHDAWTEERGYQNWRSSSGFRAYGRDPRFDRRQECLECGGTGRNPFMIDACEPCDGTGVVTLPAPYDDADPDDPDSAGEPR